MEELFVAVIFFIAVPWIVLHYITKWKTAAAITPDDEVLLEELYRLAKRLDERMDTVERLAAMDNPEFKPLRIRHEDEAQDQSLRELDRLLARRENRK